jgi:hypothetical protein
MVFQANTENVRVSADDSSSSQAGYHPTQGWSVALFLELFIGLGGHSPEKQADKMPVFISEVFCKDPS